jgi:hypothetical protein
MLQPKNLFRIIRRYVSSITRGDTVGKPHPLLAVAAQMTGLVHPVAVGAIASLAGNFFSYDHFVGSS